jgi:hypothetical protein
MQRIFWRHLKIQNLNPKNKMPYGKGTYGNKVGRPSKAAKAKGKKPAMPRKKCK